MYPYKIQKKKSPAFSIDFITEQQIISAVKERDAGKVMEILTELYNGVKKQAENPGFISKANFMVAYTLYHAMEACGIPVDETMDNELSFSRRLNSLSLLSDVLSELKSFLAACFQRAEQKSLTRNRRFKPQLSICKITIRRISPFRRWRARFISAFLISAGPSKPPRERDIRIMWRTNGLKWRTVFTKPLT